MVSWSSSPYFLIILACKGKSWLILGSLPLNKLVTKEYEKLCKSHLKEKWVHGLSEIIFLHLLWSRTGLLQES